MRPCLMSQKYILLTFKGICMNFLLELKFFILSHPVTSKQPHKIVQIHMRRPVCQIAVSLCKKKVLISYATISVFMIFQIER